MRPVLESLARAAAYDYPVLLTGEPGVGKEACALAVHAASRRASKVWVPANCANLTPTLAASLLFGHRRGSFTGADRDHAGLAESAQGSTLFLDEVGDLPIEVQPQVLRFLQDGTFLPIGETRTRQSDARVVCATNRDLPADVAQGRFREDLFHRLNVIWIVVPPLRRRPEDIPMLFDHFLTQAMEKEGIKPLTVDPAVLTRLAAYHWPGNVRELQNLVKALIVAAHGTDSIREEHLPERFLSGRADGEFRTSLAAQLEDAERAILAEALAESGGNLSAAARRLSITRQSLFNKMRRLGIRKPE
jgi:DNA-binding NtrC family response regulator